MERSSTAKCLCGHMAKLHHRHSLMRVHQQIVKVKNVPVFICDYCGEGSYMGPDSLRMSELAKIAASQRRKVIEFTEVGGGE